MNTYYCSISPFRSFVLGFALLLFCLASGNAASDADVTIVKATKIVIEENTITINAEARATVRLISGNPSLDYKGLTWGSWPVTGIHVYSLNATFVIKRPLLSFNDPDGTHGKEKAESQKTLDNGWEMTLTAAKDLQDGKEVGRIGYYAPDMTIRGNMIASMTGFGYLYPKRK